MKMLCRTKRLMILFMAAMLVVTMMPAYAFAEPGAKSGGKISVDYYDSSKSQIKSIDLNDWHYYDVSKELGNTLDDNTLKKIASQYLLPDWSHVATGIFDSESVANHTFTFTSGATWNGSSHNWEWWFDNKNDVNELRINLADWLKNPNGGYRYDEKSTLKYPSCTQSTDVGVATNLGQIREKMAAEIDDCIDPVSPVSAAKILDSRSDGALSPMKSNKETKAVYKIVTSMDYAAPMETDVYYNSYGICFYDFSLDVVMDDNLEYTNSKYISSKPNPPDYSTTHIKDNTTSESEPYTVSYDRSYTQTLSNNISASNTLTIGGEIGGEIGGSFKIFGTGVDAKIDGHLNAQKAMQTAYGEEKSTAYTNNFGTTSGKDVHPHTRYSTTHQDTDVTDKIEYDCPVVLNYKVAIFSISGSVRVVTGLFGTRGDFYTEFGYKNSDGGTNAPANLRKRTESDDYESTYGTTQGYYKGNNEVNHLQWKYVKEGLNKSVHKDDRTNAINKIKGELPLLSSGAYMDVVNKGTYEDDNPLQALYQLMDIKFNTGLDKFKDYQSEEEYALHINDTMEFGGVKVQGFDREHGMPAVPYEGFDSSKGSWVLCDKDGKPIQASADNPIKLTVNSKKNQVTVEGQKEGTGYITWVLDKDVKYKAVYGQTVSASENAPTYPKMIFNVSKIHPDVSGYSVKVFDTKNNALPAAPEPALEAYEGEDLNLSTLLRSKVFKGDEVVAYTTDYELTDPGSAATIDKNGNFNATEEGKNGVKAVYHYKGTESVEPVDLKSQEFTINVNPERKIAEIRVGYDEPERQEFRGEVSPKVPVLTYDIGSHLRYYDQYGDPWGEQSWQKDPKLNLEVIEGTDLEPEVIEDSLFRVTKGGDYVVRAEAVEDGNVQVAGSGDVTADINFNISEIKGIDKPTVKNGLVYNGKEQVGVEETEGYNLTGNTGTDAGKYEAIAYLNNGYMWNDLTEDPVALEFVIAPKKTARPSAKSLKYNGKAQTAVTSGEGYTVAGGTNTNAGTYTAKATLLKNYAWSDGSAAPMDIKYTISKASQKPSVKAKTKTVKVKKLKKKKQVVKAITVKNQQGKVTYKKSSGSKKLTVNSKNGKITVKKGTKKGSYKIKVKVKAAGNKNYNAATKTVTVKVKVK